MVQQLLLAGQALVVIFVYVFVWRMVSGARADLRQRGSGGAASIDQQESTILPASTVEAARRAAGLGEPRIVVEHSSVLRAGVPFVIGGGLRLGRSDDNDIVLDEGVVSSHHARIVPPGTVVDDASTNGTVVNGERIAGRHALRSGDRVQVGSTVFRFEVAR